MSLSPTEIANIERAIKDSSLTEVHIEQDGERIVIGSAASVARPPPEPIAVTAPAVGTISDVSRSIEDHVTAGDQLASLNVLDTALPIQAPTSGRIAAILVEDGSLVSYGAELFLIEPEETI